MARYLVIDHSIQLFLANRLLDPEFAKCYPGATVFTHLAEQARAEGWEIMTADVFLEREPKFEKAVCLSNEFTSLFPKLIAKGVKPGLLLSGESPNIARQFYLNLQKGSRPFPHASLFRGALNRLTPGCTGHPFLWPNPESTNQVVTPWKDRHLLCMVARSKGLWPGLRTLPKHISVSVVWRFHQWVEPSLRFKNLYPLRIELIRNFGPREGFRLYGHGWEELLHSKYRKFLGIHHLQTLQLQLLGVRFANPPTACDDKLATMAKCRFALAIENCAFPGYVTEKIFDVFRAGVVPVYLGAPDIEDFVPSECFIDYRKFNSPNELWEMISAFSHLQWEQYLNAAQTFLSSDRYKMHLEANVAHEWLDWVDDAAH